MVVSLRETWANGHERGQRYVDTGECGHCADARALAGVRVGDIVRLDDDTEVEVTGVTPDGVTLFFVNEGEDIFYPFADADTQRAVIVGHGWPDPTDASVVVLGREYEPKPHTRGRKPAHILRAQRRAYILAERGIREEDIRGHAR